ncbi:TPA: hypothetical protein ACGO1T_000868 [Streptococcus suis]
MVKADEYNYIKYHHKKIRLTMKDGTIDTGIYLGFDSEYDNDEGDGFILDVDGDVYSGRLVLEKDVEKVEFLN